MGLGNSLFHKFIFVPFFFPRQEKSRWEVLQQEQRLMEEKNKRKKALLAQAIAER